VLTGEISDWKAFDTHSKLGKIRIVFDNPNSSTVRYLKDSVCNKKPFSNNVKAEKTNKSVIDFVSKTPDAIGIIGVNWVCNPNDSTNLSFIEKIRVMSVSVSDEAREDNSYQPFAAYLVLERYPLRRDIYMITSDVQGGLPSGLMNFIGGNQGQRIILKSGLVPATRPMRLITVKDN
jgi:phosphate transport system substrate-binding protein